MPDPVPTRAVRDARAANQASYGDGESVREYLLDEYHRSRRAIAAHLLAAALRRPDAPAGPVLELGTGSRGILAPRTGGRPAVLADLAIDALRSAWQCPGRAVCLDAAGPLPFRDGCFAGLIMGDLIEHVYDSRRLLRECHRVLCPGGMLVITTPNLAGIQDRLGFLGGRAPRQVDPLHPYLWLHIRPFTASLLARSLRDAAFEPVAVRSNYVVWRLPSGRWLRSRTLARLAPGLGGSLVVSARRPPVRGAPQT
jgi:SAM-dependent methyltransferase